MSRIRFDGVSKAYGETVALDGFDLDVGEGEFLALLGPSGCGKTTALRLLAGFLSPTAGRILVDEQDVSTLPPHKRNAGMVFQDYALFPHMTVEDNIAFGLHERGQKGAATRSAWPSCSTSCGWLAWAGDIRASSAADSSSASRWPARWHSGRASS